MKLSQSIVLFGLLCNQVSVHASTDLGDGFITTTSDVSEQADMVLDIKEMRDKLRRRDFGSARAVYEDGVNSQSSLQELSTAIGTRNNKYAGVPAFWFQVWGITSGNYRTINDFLTYADDYVTDTLDDRNSGTVAAEAALVLNTWMEIASKFYVALDKCREGESSDAFEEIDAAAAYWVGAEQTLSLGSGHSMFELTQQVDSEFGGRQSVAAANEKFKDIYEDMTSIISRGGCRASSGTGSVQLFHLANRMISVMMIPLMQKLIQAIVDDDVQMIKLYALSVIPQIFTVHTSVGRLLMDRLHYFDYESGDEDEIIRALQSSYSGLGFTCEDIGEYRNEVSCEEPGNRMVGYPPSADVRNEARIDLDILHIKILCRASAFEPALDIYTYGKHSGSEFDYLTLQQLATDNKRENAKPWLGFFEDYWNGDQNYADTFIVQSLEGKGRFANLSDLQRGEFIFKGLQYHVMYMAGLGEFYTSYEMCKDRDSDSAAAWDTGVAFIVGSIEGTKKGGGPTSDGMSLYNLANKRCTEWNTCQTVDPNDRRAAKARLIEDYHFSFELGGNAALLRRCNDIKEAADKLALDLLIPIMQGTMRYAVKNEKLNAGTDSKDLAEGEIFSTGFLPVIAQANRNAQRVIERNMLIESGKQPVPDGPQAVADALRSVVDYFDATCSDIGYHVDVNVNVCGATEASSSGDEPWWCFLRPQNC